MMIIKPDRPIPKSVLARQQGISVSSLYYRPKKPEKDWRLKNRIEKVLSKHPSYGHKRIAIKLKINKKCALRVMKLFGIKPYRRRGRKLKKTKDLRQAYPNLLEQITFPVRSNVAWVSDFTRFSFHGKPAYLATIMDIFNRKIVGWSLMTSHTVQLTVSALINAIDKYGRPKILHSDQGSEYRSRTYARFAINLGIKLSMSRKSSPWENGYQESFYSHFKVDLGDPNRFGNLGELAAAIYLQIYYYNNLRIHTKLKMPPQEFIERQSLTINTAPVIL